MRHYEIVFFQVLYCYIGDCDDIIETFENQQEAIDRAKYIFSLSKTYENVRCYQVSNVDW